MVQEADQKLRGILSSLMPGGPAELSEFAAHSALNELICNWSAALCQGYALPQLTADVDSVIEILSQFKAKCLNEGSLKAGDAL